MGIGSDFDGINTTPAGLEDVSKYPELVRACELSYYAADANCTSLQSCGSEVGHDGSCQGWRVQICCGCLKMQNYLRERTR